MPKKLTITQVRKEFSDRNYELLTTEYEGSRQRFKYRCDKGHISYTRLDHLREGRACSACVGNRTLTLEYIRNEFLLEGYELITDEYINSKTELKFICPNGHEGTIYWNNWHTGYRCLECAGTKKYTLEYIKKSVGEFGYELITTNYVNNKTKLELICPNGHLYNVTWDNWSSKKSRCPKCKNIGTSAAEGKLYTFVKSMCNNAIRNDRTIISPYELDIVIPDKKIAIEYCGLYWHSECRGKDSNYHLNKLNMCNDVGYRLITIFEDEWVSKNGIVKDKLRNILVKKHNKVYAHDCSAKIISNSQVVEFCKINYLYKMFNADHFIGAFYNNNLVAVMGVHRDYPLDYFVSGCCTKINFYIENIDTVLLCFFENKFKLSVNYVYIDRRWDDVSKYSHLGFNYYDTISPVCWLFHNNKRRFLKKLVSCELTNHCIEKAQAINKIWDCGQIKCKKEKVCNISMTPHYT